jgi:hypothetical protein
MDAWKAAANSIVEDHSPDEAMMARSLGKMRATLVRRLILAVGHDAPRA